MTDAIEEIAQDNKSEEKSWEGGFLLEMALQALESGDIDGTVRYYQSARKLIPQNTKMEAKLEKLGEKIKDHINGNGKHSEDPKGNGNVKTSTPLSNKNMKNAVSTEEKDLINEKEHLKAQKIKKIKSQKQLGRITGIFQKHFYSVPELSRPFYGTDLIALRALKVSENKHVLLIIPLKLCNKQDTPLIIRESNIKLLKNSTEESKQKLDHLHSIIKNLTQSQDRIIENISKKEEIFKIAYHYLGGTYTLEIIKDHRVIYFHDGLTEYKVIINPLLIVQDKVGFAEKVIPFAYQRSNNIHFLNYSQLPKFISFLERKVINQVKYSEGNNTIEIKAKLYNTLLTQVQYSSLAFLPVATILMIFALLYMSRFFVPFLGLEIISLTVYALILGYFYINYLQEKRNLHGKAENQGGGDLKGNLDKTDLELISTEFTKEEMNQLLYELFGKGLNIDISQFKVKASLKTKKQKDQPQIRPQNRNETTSSSKSNNSGKIIEKYRNLLKD